MQKKAAGYVIAILQKDTVKVDNLKCSLPVTVQFLTSAHGVKTVSAEGCLAGRACY